jgi:isocitrate dehydrogenase (NAD+)
MAIEKALKVDGVRTGDLGGKASTNDFAAAVIKRLAV